MNVFVFTLLISCVFGFQSQVLPLYRMTAWNLTYDVGNALQNQIHYFHFEVDETGVQEREEYYIDISFCSECGEWFLVYSEAHLPTNADKTAIVNGDTTGSILNPLKDQITFSLRQSDVVIKRYVGIHFEFPFCNFELGIFNKTVVDNQPSRPIPGGTGELNIKRTENAIIAVFEPASDLNDESEQLLYKTFYKSEEYTPLGFDEDWCSWVYVQDWTPYQEEFEFPRSQAGDMFIMIAVKNTEGMVSYYQRARVPYTVEENMIRTIGDILIVIIILLPIVILYSGYAKQFGLKFLLFEYVTINGNDDQPIDIMKKKGMLHSQVLLWTQLVINLAIFCLSYIWNDFLLILTSLMLPFSLIGIMGTISQDPKKLLTYLIGMLYALAFQISLLIFNLNLRSTVLYNTELELEMILLFVLSAISIIVGVLALTPPAFLFVKLINQEKSDPGYSSTSKKARVIMILSILNLFLTIGYFTIMLRFVPEFTFTVDFQVLFYVFSSGQITIGLAFLSLMASYASHYKSEEYTYISIVAVGVSALVSVLTLFSEHFVEPVFSHVGPDTEYSFLYYFLAVYKFIPLSVQVAMFVFLIFFLSEIPDASMNTFIKYFFTNLYSSSGFIGTFFFFLNLSFCVFSGIIIFSRMYHESIVEIVCYCISLSAPALFVSGYYRDGVAFFVAFFMDSFFLFLWTIVFDINELWLIVIAITLLIRHMMILTSGISFLCCNPREVENVDNERDGSIELSDSLDLSAIHTENEVSTDSSFEFSL